MVPVEVVAPAEEHPPFGVEDEEIVEAHFGIKGLAEADRDKAPVFVLGEQVRVVPAGIVPGRGAQLLDFGLKDVPNFPDIVLKLLAFDQGKAVKGNKWQTNAQDGRGKHESD